MAENEITVYIPGAAVGKGRPKFARRGNFVKTYTPEKTASYENLVKLAAQQAMGGREMMTCPMVVDVTVVVEPPASWSQKKQMAAFQQEIAPDKKPDLDNVLKALLDACNGVLWGDDKQVVEAHIRKRYGITPQTMLVAWEWSGNS